jgi:hypothetical protein
MYSYSRVVPWGLYHHLHECLRSCWNVHDFVEREISSNIRVCEMSFWVWYQSDNRQIRNTPKKTWKIDQNVSDLVFFDMHATAHCRRHIRNQRVWNDWKWTCSRWKLRISWMIQELQSLACTFSMGKVELRRFRKRILGSMSDTAFDRGKFALQRVLHELLSNFSIGPKINQRCFSEKQTVIAPCFSCFSVEKT